MLSKSAQILQITGTDAQNMVADPVYMITLSNRDITVNLTNYGCTLTSIYTTCREGVKKNIVAGFADVASYTDNPHYFGCILGRYAGRIANSAYTLNGEVVKLSANEGLNHLHGGFEGFNKKIWKIKSFIETNEKVGAVMEYISPDGEEGYPGNLWITITFTLNLSNQLEIVYQAKTDKSTPINLSNHSYFNLSGFDQENILDQYLWLNAANFTEKNEDNLPTGNILPVAGTPLDFVKGKKIGCEIAALDADDGYNVNYVLTGHSPGDVILAAKLKDERSGRVLKVFTDQPGLQLYTANIWDGSVSGQQEKPYIKHGAVALETQNFSDAPNQPGFPNSILTPGEDYRTRTIYEFSTE